VRDEANADERHHATVLAGQVDTGDDTMDSLIALRPAMAVSCVSCAGRARAVRTTLLTGQDTGSSLAAAPPSLKGVAFSPDGNLLASAYGNGTLRLWTWIPGSTAAWPAGVGW
jgi:WD40 repeat protein